MKESKFATPFGADYRLSQLEMHRLIANPPYQADDIAMARHRLALNYRGTPRQLSLGRGALDAFWSNHIALSDLQNIRGLDSIDFPGTVTIEGLKISLRPDVVFIQHHPKKGDRLGVIKFWFPKSLGVTPEIGEFVASLMHHCLSLTHSEALPPIAPELCIAFDVHRGNRFHAPKGYKNRLKQVQNGCKEIVTLWSTI